jgi:halocin C8-like bacteriocin domain-containing protein
MQGNGYDRRLNWSDNGLLDVADTTFFNASYTANTATSGKGRMSSLSTGNRKGYAGYEFDEAASVYHVRHRVYLPESGRWSRRDPLGYVDGMGLYEYAATRAFYQADPSGLDATCAVCQFTVNALVSLGCGATSAATCALLGLTTGVGGLACGLIYGAVCGGIGGTAINAQEICTSLGMCGGGGNSNPAPPPPPPPPPLPKKPWEYPDRPWIDGEPCSEGTFDTAIDNPGTGNPSDPCGCIAQLEHNESNCLDCYIVDSPPDGYGDWAEGLSLCVSNALSQFHKCKRNCSVP